MKGDTGIKEIGGKERIAAAGRKNPCPLIPLISISPFNDIGVRTSGREKAGNLIQRVVIGLQNLQYLWPAEFG